MKSKSPPRIVGLAILCSMLCLVGPAFGASPNRAHDAAPICPEIVPRAETREAVPPAIPLGHAFSDHPEWRNLIFRQLRFGTITVNARERKMRRQLFA